jgi:hypothetical protein
MACTPLLCSLVMHGLSRGGANLETAIELDGEAGESLENQLGCRALSDVGGS